MRSHPDLVINVIRAGAKRFKEPWQQRESSATLCGAPAASVAVPDTFRAL